MVKLFLVKLTRNSCNPNTAMYVSRDGDADRTLEKEQKYLAAVTQYGHALW